MDEKFIMIITSAAVGSIVSVLINLVGQYFERESRRKELFLSKAVELGIERAQFTFEVAKASNSHAEIPDQCKMAATYYEWLKDAFYKDKMPTMNSKIKKVIALEGLLFIGIFIIAFLIVQNQTLQAWIASTKIAVPSVSVQVLRERYGMMELGEIILRRAAVIGFLSILVLYGFIRFIIWAIKILKQK